MKPGRCRNPVRLAVWLLVCALALPGVAAEKPTPPEPPVKAPPSLPDPPQPGHVDTGGGVKKESADAPERGPVGGVELVPGGLTAVVEPGQVLLGRLRVRVERPSQVQIQWRVDGEVLGETRGVVQDERVFTSPPLPTHRPGSYVFDPTVSGLGSLAASYTVRGPTPPEYVTGQVTALVEGEPDRAQRIAAELGLRVVRLDVLDRAVLATLEVPAGMTEEEALGRLRARAEVRAADRVALYGVRTGELRPLQYAPDLIQVPAAQRYAIGRAARIALVDTGVDLQHPELAGRVLLGANVAPSPYVPEVHGTAVAGVILAAARMLGVAPGARILVIRACTALRPGGLEARCRTDDLVRAFHAAIRLGAKVVNVSLGGPPDVVLGTVVRDLARRALVVAAAGNGEAGYPAAVPGVMAVGSTDRRDRRDPTSPVGNFLSVTAPGVDVLTTLTGSRYVFVSGTSIAAAHVAGTAALLLEAGPDLGPDRLRQALEQNAVDLGPPGYDPEYGWGRISACRPLRTAIPSARCP
jgi:subtilisin family serine protease